MLSEGQGLSKSTISPAKVSKKNLLMYEFLHVCSAVFLHGDDNYIPFSVNVFNAFVIFAALFHIFPYKIFVLILCQSFSSTFTL